MNGSDKIDGFGKIGAVGVDVDGFGGVGVGVGVGGCVKESFSRILVSSFCLFLLLVKNLSRNSSLLSGLPLSSKYLSSPCLSQFLPLLKVPTPGSLTSSNVPLLPSIFKIFSNNFLSERRLSFKYFFLNFSAGSGDGVVDGVGDGVGAGAGVGVRGIVGAVIGSRFTFESSDDEPYVAFLLVIKLTKGKFGSLNFEFFQRGHASEYRCKELLKTEKNSQNVTCTSF